MCRHFPYHGDGGGTLFSEDAEEAEEAPEHAWCHRSSYRGDSRDRRRGKMRSLPLLQRGLSRRLFVFLFFFAVLPLLLVLLGVIISQQWGLAARCTVPLGEGSVWRRGAHRRPG